MFFDSRPGFISAGFIALNLFRLLSVIVLLCTPAISGLMIFFSLKQGVHFFYILHNVFRFIISHGYFRRDWPMFGSQHGLMVIGCALIILGTSILGDVEHSLGSGEVLGLSVRQFAQGMGVLGLVAGFFYIFGDVLWTVELKEELYSAREVRYRGSALLDPNHPRRGGGSLEDGRRTPARVDTSSAFAHQDYPARASPEMKRRDSFSQQSRPRDSITGELSHVGPWVTRGPSPPVSPIRAPGSGLPGVPQESSTQEWRNNIGDNQQR